jgi:hypothetical protein
MVNVREGKMLSVLHLDGDYITESFLANLSAVFQCHSPLHARGLN